MREVRKCMTPIRAEGLTGARYMQNDFRPKIRQLFGLVRTGQKYGVVCLSFGIHAINLQ